MALITCRDCGTQVSDAAPACPKCGRPQSVSSAPVHMVVHHANPIVVTKSAASKILLGFGSLGVIVGVVSCIASGSMQGGNAAALGGFLFLAGLAMFVVGRIIQ